MWIYIGMDQSGVNLRGNIYCYFENGILIGPRNKILIGMNTEQVRLLLGEPANINKTKDQAHSFEEWSYDNPLYPARYLHFEDNIFKSWRSE